ncbi:MAG: methyltransferase [Labilithrix sp.]|nr:methyltransferase [Labilithrix sp.]MCW5813862.1 methyltransferase [Labilithrix sp.]
MNAPSLEDVRAAVLRLFIDAPGAGLRKEDEQKCRELHALLPWIAKVRRGAHVVDAAAGKASVGLVAAELLEVGALTVIERDAGRVAACRAAAKRLTREVPVDVRASDVAAADAWPPEPDVVVALHACGPAADLVLDGAARAGARTVLVVPCCYGDAVPFRRRATAAVEGLGYVADDLLRRRIAASLVDLERALRLEAAGYETSVEELVAPTVTPHNLLIAGRKTGSPVRIARARARLDALHAAAIPATIDP